MNVCEIHIQGLLRVSHLWLFHTHESLFFLFFLIKLITSVFLTPGKANLYFNYHNYFCLLSASVCCVPISFCPISIAFLSLASSLYHPAAAE